MHSPSLVNPKPIRGFNHKKVFYIPWDLPSGMISHALKRIAGSRSDLGFFSLFRLDGKSVLFGALGASAAAIAIETVIASGAEEIILLGFCGSLSREFRIGDAVGIIRAIADEGTSRCYFPRRKTFLPAPGLADELEKSAVALPKGAIISTDAPYRETRAWLKRSRQRGAQLVDMETSAVFALAAFRGVRAASLQIVSDEIFSGRWKTGFLCPLLEDRVRDVFLPLLVDKRKKA